MNFGIQIQGFQKMGTMRRHNNSQIERFLKKNDDFCILQLPFRMQMQIHLINKDNTFDILSYFAKLICLSYQFSKQA